MKPSAQAVIEFITPTRSVQEFYNFVTNNGKNFDYCIGLGGLNGWTPLHVACKYQNVPLVKALLEMGANPNQIRSDNYPPLYDAIESGNLETVTLLMEHGARLDYLVGPIRYENCLDIAKKKENIDIVNYLSTFKISHKKLSREELEKEEYRIKEQLEKAVSSNNFNKAKNILQDKSICIGNPLYGFKHYCSPRKAAKLGNLEMVKLLAEHCDDLIEVDGWDKDTIPQVARNAGYPEIAIFLEKTQKKRYECLKQAAEKQEKEQDNETNTAKQIPTADSILTKLQENLTLEERKKFLKELTESPHTLALLTLVDPLWRKFALNLEIEIEKTKEFIRIYSLWSKSKLEVQKRSNYEQLCKKLDDFLVLAENHSQNDEYKLLREKVSDIFGEEVIKCFCQKSIELLQLKTNLKNEQKKAELTLELTLEILNTLKDNLATKPKQQKSKPSNVVGFFFKSERSMEKNNMMETDITDEEMANSTFGQGSNTARLT